jgi:hypothetical protein
MLLGPVKTSNKISHEDETWTMNNNSMPIVDQTAHIGIQRHFKDSITATIEEHLKKIKASIIQLPVFQRIFQMAKAFLVHKT